ncbi:Protein C20orf11 like protein [Chelonia mydas]|uniref:Protein C20orf11 like protein n=3 Tax=Archelosauria TaxID=1329799 RepID=M7BF90_CHEMY|nr:Protein C20orf11 like protein [Chelonia mydas]
MSYAEKPDEITKDEWMEKLNNLHIQRADMNRLIMNYLVTEGFKEAAEKFRMESGIEPSVDLETLDERIKIREMILKGQIQEAIALINSLHPELLDTNRYLYFHLQQQHLIELIRQRETEAALEFAQTQLAEQGEESRECLTEMERTLALLAFDNPEESPFGDLLNMMQRQKVWSEVNQAVLDYENRESTPKLAKLLKLLLWAQNELDQKKGDDYIHTEVSGALHRNGGAPTRGVYFPALASLFSQKVRESERAFTCSTVGTGSQFGTLVIGGAGSLLLDWYGWESVFYFSGLLTLLWVYCMFKYLLNEKELIIRLEHFSKGLSLSKQTKVPWKQLFKKAPIWAVIVAQLATGSTFFTLLSWLPTFFKDTFPESKGWVFNVVPWLVAIPTSLFSGFLSDHLINQVVTPFGFVYTGTSSAKLLSFCQQKFYRQKALVRTALCRQECSPADKYAAARYKTITVRKFMQVIGSGVSSIFALCMGQASSFCKAIVFASVSIGLQTFNHRCWKYRWSPISSQRWTCGYISLPRILTPDDTADPSSIHCQSVADECTRGLLPLMSTAKSHWLPQQQNQALNYNIQSLMVLNQVELSCPSLLVTSNNQTSWKLASKHPDVPLPNELRAMKHKACCKVMNSLYDVPRPVVFNLFSFHRMHMYPTKCWPCPWTGDMITNAEGSWNHWEHHRHTDFEKLLTYGKQPRATTTVLGLTGIVKDWSTAVSLSLLHLIDE